MSVSVSAVPVGEAPRVVPTLVALRALNLGDLLVAVPALHALRRAYPHHRRLLATSPWVHPIVDLIGGWFPVRMPGLAAPWPAELRPDGPFRRVDTVVNLHGGGPESAARLDELGPRHRIGHRGHGWPGPGWEPDEGERRRWCRLLAAHGISADEDEVGLRRPDGRAAAPAGAVVVHPGAGYGAKRWPADRFGEVAGALYAGGAPVLITGSAREGALARLVAGRGGLPDGSVWAGRLDLLGLADLVAGARLVIAGDTGVAHLAAAYGVPAVTLYGPVPPRIWAPPAKLGHRALEVPELRRGDPFAAEPDGALLGVTVPDVLAACAELLSPPAG